MDKRKKIIIQTLLSSSSSDSSSSSSNDTEQFILSKRYGVKRPKIDNYLTTVSQYDEIEFKRNFRMSKDTFNWLNNKYEAHLVSKQDTLKGGAATSPETSLLAFIWFAGNKCCIRDCAGRFGIAESTLHSICTVVMQFLCDIAPSIIKFPRSEEEKIKTSFDFEKLKGFPNVLGCIDGTFITIRTPKNKIKSTYANRHDMPALTLQAICDSSRLFLDVFTGLPGKIHDSRVFNLSFISKRLPTLCGDKYHLLGDGAYSLHKFLMTPYKDYGNLTEQQLNYNKIHSATRVKIENSFALLKSRWRQLKLTEFAEVERTANFIVSCCVLHNICILKLDEWDEDGEQDGMDDKESKSTYELVGNLQQKTFAEEKRNYICNKLKKI